MSQFDTLLAEKNGHWNISKLTENFIAGKLKKLSHFSFLRDYKIFLICFFYSSKFSTHKKNGSISMLRVERVK